MPQHPGDLLWLPPNPPKWTSFPSHGRGHPTSGWALTPLTLWVSSSQRPQRPYADLSRRTLKVRGGALAGCSLPTRPAQLLHLVRRCFPERQESLAEASPRGSGEGAPSKGVEGKKLGSHHGVCLPHWGPSFKTHLSMFTACSGQGARPGLCTRAHAVVPSLGWPWCPPGSEPPSCSAGTGRTGQCRA